MRQLLFLLSSVEPQIIFCTDTFCKENCLPYEISPRCDTRQEQSIKIVNSTIGYFSDRNCLISIENTSLINDGSCYIMRNISYKSLKSPEQWSVGVIVSLVITGIIIIITIERCIKKCRYNAKDQRIENISIP